MVKASPMTVTQPTKNHDHNDSSINGTGRNPRGSFPFHKPEERD